MSSKFTSNLHFWNMRCSDHAAIWNRSLTALSEVKLTPSTLKNPFLNGMNSSVLDIDTAGASFDADATLRIHLSELEKFPKFAALHI